MKRPTESRTYFDKRVVEYVEKNRIDVNGVYADIQRKREFLRDVLGYSRLRTGRNQFASLNECADARISSVVKGAYSGAKKRLEENVKSSVLLQR
ncbi:hypothetical protein A3K82_02900 [Candidatus Pacearchaeota archaeon RBG_19FT_COMBO_34_9]|nr:MAG: hypothetical protein A3K82_02900 [Candidatus Pacearchaeota archaeon RBG_19FT_COMBO_34_9]OGJ17004.1 MAG: hypothetical protein A3K74_01280 [Candidatus Pacearchaeota archaeon RBG_13_33_26]